MTESEFLDRLIKATAGKLGKPLSRSQAGSIAHHVFDEIAQVLKRGDTFRHDGFGTFQLTKPHPARRSGTPDISAAVTDSAIIEFNPAKDADRI